MCKTPCHDSRCALYDGAVIHYAVCNPSSAKTEVEYVEACNVEITRQVNNVATGPIHTRTYNFCPPELTSANCGINDPPQNSICF